MTFETANPRTWADSTSGDTVYVETDFGLSNLFDLLGVGGSATVTDDRTTSRIEPDDGTIEKLQSIRNAQVKTRSGKGKAK